MDKVKRHSQILEIAAQEGGVSVTDLAGLMGTSMMTIRRDLEELSRAGKLRRTHGGGVPVDPDVAQFKFARREHLMAAEKRAIAREVAAMVRPGMAVALDTGTTTLTVARALRGRGRLTVLTSSMPIASELHSDPDIEVILLGGSIRKQSPDLTGPITEDNIRRFRTHMAIIGTDAVTREGTFANDAGVARICRAMTETTERAVVVADSSKFTQTAFARCLALEEITCFVTDSHIAPAAQGWLQAKVGKVILAEAGRTSPSAKDETAANVESSNAR